MSDDDFDTAGPDGDPHEGLLASAYLDGEVTPDERALVESNPDLIDESRQLGDVRTVLAATAPVAALSEREGHLAAALDVWDRMSDLELSGEATPTAGVAGAARSGRSRRRKSRSGSSFGASQWLMSAAAVLVVVAGGLAVVRGVLDDTDDTSDIVAVEAEADIASGVPDNDELEALEVAGGNVGADAIPPTEQFEDDVASDDSRDAASSSGLFEEAEEDEAMEDEAMEDIAAVDEGDDDIGDLTTAAPPGSEDELTVLLTPEDLATFASLAIPALDDAPLVTNDVDSEPPLDSCEAQFGVEVRAGFAVYEAVPVTVGLDLDLGQALAYTDDRLGGCELIDSVPLSAADG
ncbi:MAG: hypothetical protein AB8G26_20105 [Ilumatobacter sp.]